MPSNVAIYLAILISTFIVVSFAIQHYPEISSNIQRSLGQIIPLEFGAPATTTINLTASVTHSERTFKKIAYSFSSPSEMNFLGLSGYVLLSTNSQHLVQALITVYNNVNGNCPPSGTTFSSYTDLGQRYPGSRGLASYILKTSEPRTVIIPTEFRLPVKIPIKGCIFVLLDGGDPAHGSTLTMESHMSFLYDTTTYPSPTPSIIGFGDEFCYGQTWGCFIATTCTTEKCAFALVRPINSYQYLWAFYGDVSTGVFTGNPYANPPSGTWKSQHDYYLFKKCPSWPSGASGPNDYYSQIPSDAVNLLSFFFQATGKTSVHNWTNKTFLTPILLEPGNCLIHLTKFSSANGGATTESQISALVQSAGGTLLGRIYLDSNGNGKYDSGEAIIQDPSANCGSGNFNLAGVSISWTGPTNNKTIVDKCNPQPYYSASLPAGTYSVSVNVPQGWRATTQNPITTTITAGNSSHVWFGIKPKITTFGQYANRMPIATPPFNGTGQSRILIPELIGNITDLHANTYSFLLAYSNTEFDDLKLFLEATKNTNIKTWVTLLPKGECGLYCPPPHRADMQNWSIELANLSLKYPNFVAFTIDDYWINYKSLAPDLPFNYTRMKEINPNLKFYPTIYGGELANSSVISNKIDGYLLYIDSIPTTSRPVNTILWHSLINSANKPVVVGIYAKSRPPFPNITAERVEERMLVVYNSSAIGMLLYQLPWKGFGHDDVYQVGKDLYSQWNPQLPCSSGTIPNPMLNQPCMTEWQTFQNLAGSTPSSAAIQNLGDTLIIAVRGSDNKTYVKEWNIKSQSLIKNWYVVNNGLTSDSPKLIKDASSKIYLYVKGLNGSVYYSIYQSPGIWSSWINTGICNGYFGSSGPASILASDSNIYNVSGNNPIYLNKCYQLSSPSTNLKYFGYFFAQNTCHGLYLNKIYNYTNFIHLNQFKKKPDGTIYGVLFAKESYDKGLKVFFEMTNVFQFTPEYLWDSTVGSISQNISSDLPYISVMFVIDEPYGRGFSESQLRKMVNMTKTYFPNKPTLVDFQYTDAIKNRNVPNNVDIIGIDPYIYPTSNNDCEQRIFYDTNVTPAIDWANRFNKPIVIAAQSYVNFVMPSVCQQSWYINSTNYYPRIEGIIWFLYANVTPNDPCDQGNLIGTNSFPDRIAYHQIIGKTIMCNNDWEDNPVCGSDGITYKNPDKAKCVNISFRYGNCELTTTTTTTTSDTTIPDTTTTTTSTTTTTTTTTTTEETQTTTQTISQPEEISLNTILLSMTAIIIPILLFFMLRRI